MPSSTLRVAATTDRRGISANRDDVGRSVGRVDPGGAAERPGRHSHGGPWERVVITAYGSNKFVDPVNLADARIAKEPPLSSWEGCATSRQSGRCAEIRR